MPEVSVVIPTYNRSESIKKTVSAYQTQIYRNFEIIVSDDGSTDNTVAVIEKLDLNFQLKCCTHKNAGRSAARNNGVRHAQGRIILFVDDHHIPDDRLIEEHVKFYDQYSKNECSIVSGRAVIVKSVDQIPANTEYIDPIQSKKMIRNAQNPFHFFITRNVSVLRTAFDEAGGFDENFTEYGFQDSELGYRLRKKGYMFKVNLNAVVYIISLSHTFEQRCEKMREAGHSAVIFWRKHPFFGLNLVNPITVWHMKIFDLFGGYLLHKYEKRLAKARFARDEQKVIKYENIIRRYYHSVGINESLF